MKVALCFPPGTYRIPGTVDIDSMRVMGARALSETAFGPLQAL
jgi:hypothetical protein